MVSHGVKWSSFYYIPRAATVLNIGFTTSAFWNYEMDLVQGSQSTAQQATQETTASTKTRLLRQAVKSKITILGALFILAYQGAEVAISGWVVSFLISYRGGDPAKMGYVSSGFWAGISVGRFVLSQPAQKLGKRTAVFLLTIGTLMFQLLLWLVPNIIGDAVAVGIVGLLLGPVYPCATSIFNKLLPPSIQISSLGFISAMGSSGGAMAPFFTGMLAQKAGTVVLHPICVGLYVAMEVCWVSLPRLSKRTE
jgi:fucose permease